MLKTRDAISAVTAGTVLMLLGGMAVAAAAKTKKDANAAKAGKQASDIVTAQQNYATGQNFRGQPERFVTGVERFCQPDDKPLPNGDRLSDGSRAFVYLVQRNFLGSLAAFASPADPFVAVLDLPGTALDDMKERDFPKEGVAPPADFAASSKLKVGDGHTYYSYSMQAGSMEKKFHPNVHMRNDLPLISDRNPWSEPLVTLAKKNPDDGNEQGNTWNNNREYQIAAYRDARNGRIPDARKPLEIAVPIGGPKADPAKGAAVPQVGPGLDHLYADDEVITTGTPKPAGKKYTGVGDNQPLRQHPTGIWMFD